MATAPVAIQSSVSDILGLTAEAAKDTYGATAAGYTAQGDTAEANAYGTAAGIANVNAGLTDIAGQIEQYQAKRAASATIGSERADVGAAGFRMSGSNLTALQSSYQQSYLTDQLIRTQTAMTKGGYLEQAAAATGNQSAASAAAASATALQGYATKTAATATTRATDETQALVSQLALTGTAYTPEGLAAGQALTAGGPISGVNLPFGWGNPNTQTTFERMAQNGQPFVPESGRAPPGTVGGAPRYQIPAIGLTPVPAQSAIQALTI